MTAEVIPLYPELVDLDDDRLTLTERALNKFDALAARSPIVVVRRTTIERREKNAFELGRDCERGAQR